MSYQRLILPGCLLLALLFYGKASAADTQPGFTNVLGMPFVLLPPGQFWMGSPTSERGRDADEVRHQVSLTRGFYLQTHEVTRRQWKQLMGGDPSSFPGCGDDCPVDRVKWDWVQVFIEKLNRLDPAHRYRLPTEAEWEYAARAGGDSAFPAGPCLGPDNANYNAALALPLCRKGKAASGPKPVGSYPPNRWGIYDLHGNSWEMCADWYGPYPDAAVMDPQGPERGEFRVIRGGSWKFPESFARAANRFWNMRDIAGFRLVAETSATASPVPAAAAQLSIPNP